MEWSEPGEGTWEEVGSPGVGPRQRAWLRGLRAEQGAHPGASGLGWTSGTRVAHAGCSPAPWGLFGDPVGANPSGAELSEAERLAGLLAWLALPEVVAVLMLQPCLGRPVACPAHWTSPGRCCRTSCLAWMVLQEPTPAPATGPAPDSAAGPHAWLGRCCCLPRWPDSAGGPHAPPTWPHWPRRCCAGPHAVPVHRVGPTGPGNLVSAPLSPWGPCGQSR